MNATIAKEKNEKKSGQKYAANGQDVARSHKNERGSNEKCYPAKYGDLKKERGQRAYKNGNRKDQHKRRLRLVAAEYSVFAFDVFHKRYFSNYNITL